MQQYYDHAIDTTDFNTKREIAELLEQFATAIGVGDLERIISFYSRHVTAFDMMPPLQFIDRATYQRQAWEMCFTEAFNFPVTYEFSQQQFFFEGDIAFVHGLIHMIGTFKEDQKKMECWMRNTMGLKKIKGTWLIIHEHNSVPLDMNMKGLMNLSPELMQ